MLLINYNFTLDQCFHLCQNYSLISQHCPNTSGHVPEAQGVVVWMRNGGGSCDSNNTMVLKDIVYSIQDAVLLANFKQWYGKITLNLFNVHT